MKAVLVAGHRYATGFSLPLRLDFGYQFQKLADRDFEFTSSRPSVTNPYATVTAGGEVHVFTGSLTLRFQEVHHAL